MFEMVSRWYKRRFSDPHAVSLVRFSYLALLSFIFWQPYSPVAGCFSPCLSSRVVGLFS